MDIINSKNQNEISLIEKILFKIVLNNIFPFFDKENKYILPLLLSNTNYQENLLDIKDNETNQFMVLIKFFLNCKKIYKEQYLLNKDMTNIDDPIFEIFNKVEDETNGIRDCGLNYKKYFYNYLLNVPYINISPCCSLMNIIYFNEYYQKIDNKHKKPKILNLILLIKEDIALCRINDLFGEIIFTPKNFIIKNKKISFNCEMFLKAMSKIYGFFNQPKIIIINGGDKNIKHNFKKNEYIIESILFKLTFKSNSLLIIHRV